MSHYSISNNDAMDNVVEAMDFIEKQPISEYTMGLRERLMQTIKWIEVQVDGNWEDV